MNLRTYLAALGVLAFGASCIVGAQQVADDVGRETAVATFAGGCFWCMEPPFDKLDGVLSTTSGYTGGTVEEPTYEQVSKGGTGHYEAVQVEYDPGAVDFATLLNVFWRNVDPLDAKGQFCDRGDQYRTAIFVHDARQRELAEKSKQALSKSGVLPGEIATPILDAGEFYAAEDYHQNYYQENPLRYRYYRFTCGRDGRLEELWSSVDVPDPEPARESKSN